MGVLQLRLRLVDVSPTISRPLDTALTDELSRYSTMDNVDGKQARRTGTSSPLGELFEYVASCPMRQHPEADVRVAMELIR